MWAIISNNCWGAGFYQERGIPYNTPTVGLWFYPDDYIELLGNLRVLLSSPIRFIPRSRREQTNYPVGIIGDRVEIQFMHYSDEDEARTKWNARVARLPPDDDDLYVKVCDRDGFNQRHLELFDKLPFKNKVAFLSRGRFDVSGRRAWVIEIDSAGGVVPDGVTLWNSTKNLSNFSPCTWIDQTSITSAA